MNGSPPGFDWKAALADLRAHLPPVGGGREVRGSLRWLEAEMRSRGANGPSVRNIVYRDVGTPADKAALRAILEGLAREAGRPLDPGRTATPPVPPPLSDELELLGRPKRRAYKQFLAGVRAGRAPRLIVTGRAGAGKTILLDHLERALRVTDAGPLVRLNLRGDVSDGGTLPLAPSGTSFSAQAQAQSDAARAALPASPGVLLARVTADLSFAGGPPRGPDGSPLSPAAWAAKHLLRRAPPGVAVLLALEDAAGLPAGAAEVIELRPPTPAEARAYLMARLGVPRERADVLVRETGRNQGRLALLAGLGTGETALGYLLADPDARRLAAALAALEVDPDEGVPGPALAAALGTPAPALPPHARALLREGSVGWTPLPPLLGALEHVPVQEVEEARRRLGEAPLPPDLARFRLAALAALGEWDALAAHLAASPDDARHLRPAGAGTWRRPRGRSATPAPRPAGPAPTCGGDSSPRTRGDGAKPCATSTSSPPRARSSPPAPATRRATCGCAWGSPPPRWRPSRTPPAWRPPGAPPRSGPGRWLARRRPCAVWGTPGRVTRTWAGPSRCCRARREGAGGTQCCAPGC